MLINLFILGILSILSFVFIFCLPGIFISKTLKLNIEKVELIIFSSALGFVFFTLLSFTLETLNIFYLTVPIILILDVFAIKKIRKKDFSNLKLNNKYFFLILVFSLFFSIPMIKNFETKEFILLSIDAPWHFSLINELIFHFPPNHPNMSGVSITPYHFFADYVIAKIVQVVKMDLSYVYYQFIPVIISLLWGFGVYLFIKKWIKNNLAAIFAVFLTMFGGSFSFILYLLGHKNLSIDSAFGMLQPPFSLLNPPFAMSIVVMIFGLYSVLSYLKDKNTGWFIPIAIFFGIAAMFKVYAGILLFFLLGVLFILRIINRDIKFTLVVFLIILIFLFTYMRFVGGSGFLVYAPLWAPHDVFNSNLPFVNYSTRVYLYQQSSQFLKIYILEILILLIYLIGNVGTRLIGVFFLVFLKNKKEFFLSQFTGVFLLTLIFSLFLPLLFLQSIKPFEMTQMFNYFLFLLSIFSAIGITSIVNVKMKRKFIVLFLSIFILLTLPSAIVDYKNIIVEKPEIVAGSRFQSYKFLKSRGEYDNVIFEALPKETENTYKSVNKWFRDKSDILLPSLSHKSTYLTNGPILFREKELYERIKFYQNFLTFVNLNEEDNIYIYKQKEILEIFKNNKIKYIYSSYPIKLSGLKEIYNKDGVIIYEF